MITAALAWSPNVFIKKSTETPVTKAIIINGIALISKGSNNMNNGYIMG
jgi:hypothetical protein